MQFLAQNFDESHLSSMSDVSARVEILDTLHDLYAADMIRPICKVDGTVNLIDNEVVYNMITEGVDGVFGGSLYLNDLSIQEMGLISHFVQAGDHDAKSNDVQNYIIDDLTSASGNGVQSGFAVGAGDILYAHSITPVNVAAGKFDITSVAVSFGDNDSGQYCMNIDLLMFSDCNSIGTDIGGVLHSDIVLTIVDDNTLSYSVNLSGTA